MTLERRSRWGRSVAALAALGLVAALFALAPTVGSSAADDGGQVRKQGTLGDGYALVASDGGIFNYGDSEFFGSTGALALNKPIVGMEYTPTGEGYWLVASDGGIFTFGDAEFFGSTGALALNQPIVGMSSTPTGNGYWLVAADGGIFTFGDAEFFGSTGSLKLVKPIVGIAVHPLGGGYWLVAADGGIFTFGDEKNIKFWGSMGGKPLNQPIVDMAPTDTGNGYWMVATDGGIFTFGDATFHGSQGGTKLNQPVNGMTVSPSGQGYWMVASDGGIFTHGDAVFFGSRGGQALNKPIVGMAATPFTPGIAPDFVIDLTGEQEPTGGDTDGSGFARLDFTDDELCWYIQVDNVATATAAHIHEGPLGVNGPVVFTFFDAPITDGVSVACKAIDPALSKAIMGDPERYYVNVHNADFPGGAVRGQVLDEFVIGATADNKLVGFFASTPETLVIEPTAATGLGAGEAIAGLDGRPKTGVFYALTVDGSAAGRIYTVGTDAKLTRVGSTSQALTGATFGFDFDPTDGMIHVTADDDQHFTVDPDTGVWTAGGAIAPGSNDITGAAFDNNVEGASASTLYGIDSAGDMLVMVDADTGAVTPAGADSALDFDASDENGFDIGFGPEGKQNNALLVAKTGTGTAFDVYALNTAADAGTAAKPRILKLGTVGDGTTALTAIALV